MMLYGQSELKFKQLTTADGLSQNSVWSILQDREGFMWFGTQDGLNKYDGYNFTILKPDPDDQENTLHHNIISDIHEDRKGRLWVTTFGGGFHQIDKYTGLVTRYGISPANTNLWNGLASIYEDQQGFLYICGNGGVARFDPESKTFTLYHSPAETEAIFSIVEDSAGRFWAGGRGGIFLLDRISGKYSPVELDSTLVKQPNGMSLFLDRKGILWVGTAGEGLFFMDTHASSLHFTRYNPGGMVSKKIRFNGIYQDDMGYLWLSGSEGLQRIDKQRHEVLNFKANPGQSGSLSHHNVHAIYQDREGSIWIGTDNGVNRLPATSKGFQSYQFIPTYSSVILQENSIGTLLEDYTGIIWLGSAGNYIGLTFGNGLYQFDAKNRKIKHFPASASNPDSLTSNMVYSIYEDKKKRLWVGTNEAIHLYDRSVGKFIRYPSAVSVEYIEEDLFGKLWIGSYGATISGRDEFFASFDPEKETFNYYQSDPKGILGPVIKNVWDIMASRNGDVWIALSGAGIARLNQGTGKFTSYLSSPTASPGYLNDKDVRALYEDEKGVIWAGTNQGGLHRFDSLTNTFTYFTVNDGLPSNHIVSIIGDTKGNLWMGSNKGLSRFNPETKTFRNFNISDGLPANEFRLGSVYSRNGRLMFGSVNGFVIFHPDSIKENTTVPPVYITGLKVLEKSRTLPTDQIELPYYENFLSFEFVALNYNAPEKNQYAYKLEGLDKDWIYSGTRRFASYTNLDPGNYIFQVKGSNNDGLWNEVGASLQITILPPWWKTWWAYGLWALLALGMVLVIRKYEIRRFKLRQRAAYLSELDSEKSRFFANISHEFRTPLTLILGPLQKFVARSSDDNQDKPIYRMMQRNGQRLLELINQLLDLSKLEAGNMKLETKPAEIVGFLKAIMLSFTSLADCRKIRFIFNYPNKNEVGYFDADKLEKIMVNLLSNAFKFTPEGGEISVMARLLPTEDQGILSHFQISWPTSSVNILEIIVQDNGKGMQKDQLNKVFDRFYQSDDSHTREQEGTGIGLALVKELVELHKGEITVESQPGKGACFTVKIPLPLADQEELVISGPENNVQKDHESLDLMDAEIDLVSDLDMEIDVLEAPIVLIVEDNADVRFFIRESLQPFYRILEAADGKEGYKKALQSIPDLILSDVMMPKINGMDLCLKLKQNEMTAHIPVVLLTAKAS